MSDPEAPPLDEVRALALLRGHDLVNADEAVDIRPMGGGVSSIVLLAVSPRRRLVLKQARARFRVADEWIVDDRRILVEHAFLRALPPHLPAGCLPKPVALVPHLRVLVMEAAPPGYTSWKERLLRGVIDDELPAQAARLLAALHEATPTLGDRFRNPALFDQQRLDPYFRTSAQRLPDLAPALHDLVTRFAQRDDLVHGDFSPKNLLTDGRRLVLIDHEVATRGDAAFDVAFLLTHLTLKALHRPPDAERLRAGAARFVDAYADGRATDAGFPGRVATYLGGLLVARAIGKSPAEYLSARERAVAVDVGRAWLGAPVDSWGTLATRVEEAHVPPRAV